MKNRVDPALIHKGLGGLKLECVIKMGIFAAPKVYAIRTEDDTEIVKFKGVPRGVAKFEHVEALFQGKNVEFQLERWTRNKYRGVHINPIKYTVRPSGNEKREKVYDDTGT